MKLSTWWQLLGFYEVLLVWPLVLVTLYLTLTARTRRGRIAGVAFLVLWLMPFIHRAIGDAYFDYLCKHEAGEFIYRTVDNVEGILQMRPRDGSKDYFDRMAEGDIPEDPWGHTNAEAQMPWVFIGKYRFFESLDTSIKVRETQVPPFHASMIALPGPGDTVARYFGYNRRDLDTLRKEFDDKARSRYGFTWRESRGLLDHLFNVHPGIVTVQAMSTSEVLGFMKGYMRLRPLRACPPGKHEFFVRDFIERVLRPIPTNPQAGKH